MTKPKLAQDVVKMNCLFCHSEFRLSCDVFREVDDELARKCPRCGSLMRTDRDNCIVIETES